MATPSSVDLPLFAAAGIVVGEPAAERPIAPAPPPARPKHAGRRSKGESQAIARPAGNPRIKEQPRDEQGRVGAKAANRSVDNVHGSEVQAEERPAGNSAQAGIRRIRKAAQAPAETRPKVRERPRALMPERPTLAVIPFPLHRDLRLVRRMVNKARVLFDEMGKDRAKATFAAEHEKRMEAWLRAFGLSADEARTEVNRVLRAMNTMALQQIAEDKRGGSAA